MFEITRDLLSATKKTIDECIWISCGKSYYPQSKWSKSKYSLKKKIKILISLLVVNLCKNISWLKCFDLYFFDVDTKDIFVFPEKEINEIYGSIFLLIPNERSATLKKGIQRLCKKQGISWNSKENIDEAFSHSRRVKGGFFDFGLMSTIRSDASLIRSFKVMLDYSFSSHLLLRIQYNPSDIFKEKMNNILQYEHRPRCIINIPDKYTKVWGRYNNSAAQLKAEDIDDLILDSKWEVIDNLMQYCNEKYLTNCPPPASIDIYSMKYVSDLSKYGEFFIALGIPITIPELDFYSEDMNGSFYYGDFNGLKDDSNLRIAIKTDKLFDEIEFSQARLINKILENVSPLLVMDMISRNLEVEATRLSEVIYIKAKKKLFSAFKDITNITETLDRIKHDYCNVNIIDLLKELPQIKSKKEMINERSEEVFFRIEKIVSKRLEDTNSKVQLSV